MDRRAPSRDVYILGFAGIAGHRGTDRSIHPRLAETKQSKPQPNGKTASRDGTKLAPQ